jgi:2-iminobutanoate/2-iminopropanoate deaminase
MREEETEMKTGVSPAPPTGARTSIYVDGFAHKNPIPAAARIGNMVYASSMHGRDSETGEIAATLEEQCKLMFSHLRRIVEAAGGATEDIIKVSIWMADPTQRDAVNKEWVAMFPDPASRPARHTMQAKLGGGQLVVCDFIAVVRENNRSEGRGL